MDGIINFLKIVFLKENNQGYFMTFIALLLFAILFFYIVNQFFTYIKNKNYFSSIKNKSVNSHNNFLIVPFEKGRYYLYEVYNINFFWFFECKTCRKVPISVDYDPSFCGLGEQYLADSLEVAKQRIEELEKNFNYPY